MVRLGSFLVGAVIMVAALCPVAFASEVWCGVYVQGSKIGHTYLRSVPTERDGEAGIESETSSVMTMRMLGTELDIRLDTRSWYAADGTPRWMSFRMRSGGREQNLMARFEGKSLRVEIDNNGQRSEKTLEVPPDAPIVEDPLLALLDAQGERRSIVFYVLDPTTVSLIRNEAVLVGEEEVRAGETTVSARVIEIRDPRITTKAYFTAKGDLIKMQGPMGMQIVAEPKEIALAMPDAYRPTADLALASSLGTDRPIGDPSRLESLTLRLRGDLSRVPSGDHQQVERTDDGWIVTVRPPSVTRPTVTIERARATMADWARPSLHMPSDDPEMVALARTIIGERDEVLPAAIRIKDWVYANLNSNAGIGVLRDAREVLATKEGVCRDYAILTATLLRAAGIPTRLASGLTLWQDRFYYHAWVEVWNGDGWIGLDSTEARSQISPAHVKLAEGNVEQAFTFTFLDGIQVEVLETKPR